MASWENWTSYLVVFELFGELVLYRLGLTFLNDDFILY